MEIIFKGLLFRECDDLRVNTSDLHCLISSSLHYPEWRFDVWELLEIMFIVFLGTEINNVASVPQIAVSSNRTVIIIKMIIVLFMDVI